MTNKYNPPAGTAPPVDDTLERLAVIDPIMRYFSFAHLKTPELQEVSRRFADLACWVASELPRNPERTVALRKILEAKDAAVRAALP